MGQLHRHRRKKCHSGYAFRFFRASAAHLPLQGCSIKFGLICSGARRTSCRQGAPSSRPSQHSAGANGAEMSRRFPAALPFSGVSLEKALHSVTTVHAAKTDLGLRKDVGFHAEGFMESYVRHARGRPEKCKDNSMKRTALITHQLKNESNLQSVFILGDIQGGSDGFGNACNSSQSADTI